MANLSVLIAGGVVVAWTRKAYLDLIIGAVVAMVVLNITRRILPLRGA